MQSILDSIIYLFQLSLWLYCLLLAYISKASNPNFNSPALFLGLVVGTTKYDPLGL